jgi:hypothetical protein
MEIMGDSRNQSRLILSAVAIDSIDAASRDLGGRIGISLLVPDIEVPDLIEAINSAEFLLVRRALAN